MRPITLAPAVAALAMSASPPAFADEALGWALAGEHCARCHDITANPPPKQYPPSFAAIAVFRPVEQIHARIVFPATHTGMPEVAFYLLTNEQVNDLVDYIVSLDPAVAEEMAPEGETPPAPQ